MVLNCLSMSDALATVFKLWDVSLFNRVIFTDTHTIYVLVIICYSLVVLYHCLTYFGWQVMKNQEAVDLVKPIKDPQAAAKRLTAEALAKESKDDISCIVIRFG